MRIRITHVVRAVSRAKRFRVTFHTPVSLHAVAHLTLCRTQLLICWLRTCANVAFQIDLVHLLGGMGMGEGAQSHVLGRQPISRRAPWREARLSRGQRLPSTNKHPGGLLLAPFYAAPRKSRLRDRTAARSVLIVGAKAFATRGVAPPLPLLPPRLRVTLLNRRRARFHVARTELGRGGGPLCTAALPLPFLGLG